MTNKPDRIDELTADPVTKNPLKDGVVGREIVDYFETQGYEYLPIWAELIGKAEPFQINYRLTFEDEYVADYKFYLEPQGIFNIESVELFNQVT